MFKVGIVDARNMVICSCAAVLLAACGGGGGGGSGEFSGSDAGANLSSAVSSETQTRNAAAEPDATTATPAASTSPASGYTNIDQVIADMGLKSEALPINASYNWQFSPVITQYAPRGDAIASWWPGNRPEWCYTALSWFTAYEAEGNAATNSRVQLKDLRMYVLSQSTRKWTRVDLSAAPRMGLWQYPFNFASDSTGERNESTGGKSIKPQYPQFHHGYGNAYVMPDPADVRATFMAMDIRLTVEDSSKPDDRAKARYVVDVGGDYYPGRDTSMTWSEGYAPGMGNGRYLLATNNWRTATLIVPNTGYGATMEEMRNNPPPMN